MKADGWYGFPPPKPGDRAARGVHFLSVLYIYPRSRTVSLRYPSVFRPLGRSVGVNSPHPESIRSAGFQFADDRAGSVERDFDAVARQVNPARHIEVLDLIRLRPRYLIPLNVHHPHPDRCPRGLVRRGRGSLRLATLGVCARSRSKEKHNPCYRHQSGEY